MRTVLITGASRGLGLEFVRQLARRESSPEHIFAACRAPERAKELQGVAAAHDNVKVVQIDLQNESTFKPAVDAVSEVVGKRGLNVLINNAAIFAKNSYETVSRQVLTNLLDVNLIGPIRLTQALLPLIRLGASNSPVEDMGVERGAIINISSAIGSISTNAMGMYAGYRESKVALNMFSKSMCNLLKPEKILVVSQTPAIRVSTDMGGPDAMNTPEASVAGMLEVQSHLTQEHNGHFFDDRVPEAKLF